MRTTVIPTRAPDWDAAACRTVPNPEIFFPEKGESAAPGQLVCHRCPIRRDCGSWALALPEEWGVWGGMTERQRRRIRRRRTAGAKPPTTASPGETQPLAAEQLRAHPGVAFTASEVARAIGRHPRTVETALTRLAAAGQAQLAGDRPRRYAAPGTGPLHPLPAAHAPNGDVVGRVRRHMWARPGIEQSVGQVTAVMPDLKPRSIAQALSRMAKQGELTQLPGRRARYLISPIDGDPEAGTARGRLRAAVRAVLRSRPAEYWSAPEVARELDQPVTACREALDWLAARGHAALKQPARRPRRFTAVAHQQPEQQEVTSWAS